MSYFNSYIPRILDDAIACMLCGDEPNHGDYEMAAVCPVECACCTMRNWVVDCDSLEWEWNNWFRQARKRVGQKEFLLLWDAACQGIDEHCRQAFKSHNNGFKQASGRILTFCRHYFLYGLICHNLSNCNCNETNSRSLTFSCRRVFENVNLYKLNK